MGTLVLVANPGSASRKYALYDGDKCLAKFHFEYADRRIVCTLETASGKSQAVCNISHLSFSASQLPQMLFDYLKSEQTIKLIALRVVAPSTSFQRDRWLDKSALEQLSELEPEAPLHINATLQEANLLRKYFPEAKLAGISDSAFHSTIGEPANRYGLPLNDADQLGLKRFGYQGLSVESVVTSLHHAGKLPKRLVICHLGSGSSVTAVKDGKSFDTTMGYSPLEGLVMATRSGSLDLVAALRLQKQFQLKDHQLLSYLNEKSGLLGVSGISSDIRELLALEGHHERAALALKMYVYRVQQAIGQMAAALGGLDAVIFTGTVGERSQPMRQRIIHKLLFLGLAIDPAKNHASVEPGEVVLISPAHHPVKLYIVPANEDVMLAKHAQELAG